jgi:hypothetical protein
LRLSQSKKPNIAARILEGRQESEDHPLGAAHAGGLHHVQDP